MNKIFRIGLIGPIVLLSSCALFAPEERTELNADLPAQFSLYSSKTPDTARWWENFGSTELNQLMNEALTNSPSIQQAWARLAQAQAVAAKAGAAQAPTLDYNAGASSSVTESSVGPKLGRDSFNSFTLGLTASYEVDLWGRVKSQTEAARLDRDVSREDLNTAAITLTSQVATRWAAILSERLKTEIIRQQLAANKKSEELIELRFRKSISSALDVYQQRQTVANTESSIPLAELRERLQRNELAALLGRSDFNALSLRQTALPTIGPLPPTGIPADLLANRPDIRRAGLRLQSADWQVSAAKADRLPTLRLTASASYSASDVDILFDNWAARLAASVAGPIFDAGKRKAEAIRTRAVVDERIAAYRETVLNAIKEVENALAQEQKQRDYLEALQRRLDASRTSYGEAVNRYRNGLIEYTTVLLQLNALQSLERERVTAQYDLLINRINLYRALGGDWKNLSE